MLCRLEMGSVLGVAWPSDSAEGASQGRTTSWIGLVQMLLARHVASCLGGTPEGHSADVTPQRILFRLMGLACEVTSQLGLEFKMKRALGAIKLGWIRFPVMVLCSAMRRMLLRSVTLMPTRRTQQAFEFVHTSLLYRLAADPSCKTVLLNAMLAGSGQTVKGLAADTGPVRREATRTGSLLGEMARYSQQILAVEASAAEGAEPAEESFAVLYDVREVSHADINLAESRMIEDRGLLPEIDEDDVVRLRSEPVGVELWDDEGLTGAFPGRDLTVGLHRQPGTVLGSGEGGVGDVHFLRRKVFFCRFLCLNPSLPPYLYRSPSSLSFCVFYPIPYRFSLQTINQRSLLRFPPPLPAKMKNDSPWGKGGNWLTTLEGVSLLKSTQLPTKRDRGSLLR